MDRGVPVDEPDRTLGRGGPEACVDPCADVRAVRIVPTVVDREDLRRTGRPRSTCSIRSRSARHAWCSRSMSFVPRFTTATSGCVATWRMIAGVTSAMVRPENALTRTRYHGVSVETIRDRESSVIESPAIATRGAPRRPTYRCGRRSPARTRCRRWSRDRRSRAARTRSEHDESDEQRRPTNDVRVPRPRGVWAPHRPTVRVALGPAGAPDPCSLAFHPQPVVQRTATRWTLRRRRSVRGTLQDLPGRPSGTDAVTPSCEARLELQSCHSSGGAPHARSADR